MFALSSRWAACSLRRLTPTGVAQPLPNRTRIVRAIVRLPNHLVIATRSFFKSYEPERSGSAVAQEIRVTSEARGILIAS